MSPTSTIRAGPLPLLLGRQPYRTPPRCPVPGTDEIAATLECLLAPRRTPLTTRGAGTSIAGNAVGAGVVLDTSRYLNRVLESTGKLPRRSSSRAWSRRPADSWPRRAGLRFGPDPSTHTRCTIGGMIGNNACGSRALGYGRTVDNVAALTCCSPTVGASTAARPGGRAASGERRSPRRPAHARDRAGRVRTEFGRFGRQVSGYSFEHLLPGERASVGRALVGSEGTLAVVLGATVRLVEDAPYRRSPCSATRRWPTRRMPCPRCCRTHWSAARASTSGSRDCAAGAPTPGRRGLAVRRADRCDRRGGRFLAPPGARTAGAPHLVVTDTPEQLALWQIREDGAGLAARTRAAPPRRAGRTPPSPPSSAPISAASRRSSTSAGWRACPTATSATAVSTGGSTSRSGHGRPGQVRAFVEGAANLVASYGGSMSGEHGDGPARSELLPRMYSPNAIALMQQAKRILDPHNLLNPGVLVEPAPFDWTSVSPRHSARGARRCG